MEGGKRLQCWYFWRGWWLGIGGGTYSWAEGEDLAKVDGWEAIEREGGGEREEREENGCFVIGLR